jgi:MYXO-CTERM domain-containing protein
MKKTLIAGLALGAVAMTASAENYSFDLNGQSDTSGIIGDHDFGLGAVASVESISLNLATTWGGDFEITLTASDGSSYEFMNDNQNGGSSTNYDLGQVAGDGTLANVATYVFVASGGGSWDPGATGFAGAGTYNANAFPAGGFAAGTWNILVNDDAGGDISSVGNFTMNYTAVPAPGALALLGLGGLAVTRRRRA